jgi:hypothetical protein
LARGVSLDNRKQEAIGAFDLAQGGWQKTLVAQLVREKHEVLLRRQRPEALDEGSRTQQRAKLERFLLHESLVVRVVRPPTLIERVHQMNDVMPSNHQFGRPFFALSSSINRVV